MIAPSKSDCWGSWLVKVYGHLEKVALRVSREHCRLLHFHSSIQLTLQAANKKKNQKEYTFVPQTSIEKSSAFIHHCIDCGKFRSFVLLASHLIVYAATTKIVLGRSICFLLVRK